MKKILSLKANLIFATVLNVIFIITYIYLKTSRFAWYPGQNFLKAQDWKFMGIVCLIIYITTIILYLIKKSKSSDDTVTQQIHEDEKENIIVNDPLNNNINNSDKNTKL